MERAGDPEISRRLNDRLAAEGLSADQLGERSGWEVTDVLKNPEALWHFNLVGLLDVSNAIGLDWVAALPESAPVTQGKS